MRTLFFSTALITFVFAAMANAAPTIDTSKAPQSDVFDSPESVHWVPEVKSWFVSSMGGPELLAKDNYGWISRLDENGKVVTARWVQKGLHSPAGICHIGKELYVIDRDGIVVIDIDKAAILKTIELPGVKFPNDIVCDKDGSVYASETEQNIIYRWKRGMDKAEVWLQNKDLDSPNGLEIDGGTMYVITWGQAAEKNTHTIRGGYLRTIDIKTKKLSLGTGANVGNMDGLFFVGKRLFATDWLNGRIFAFDKNLKPSVHASGFSHIADAGYSKELKVVGIPEMSTNRVYFIHME